MSNELACRAVASARRETFRHRDGNDRLLTLRSPLLFRRGEATSAVGLRYCSQDAPHICREDTFPAGKCFSPLHCEGRDNRAVHSARSRRRLVVSPSQGFLASAPKLFSVDRIGREDYRIIGENRDGCFAKSFFAGKFGVSLFRSNERPDSFLKIDIRRATVCQCQACDKQEKFRWLRQDHSLAAS